jgi:chromosome segregation ATPase
MQSLKATQEHKATLEQKINKLKNENRNNRALYKDELSKLSARLVKMTSERDNIQANTDKATALYDTKFKSAQLQSEEIAQLNSKIAAQEPLIIQYSQTQEELAKARTDLQRLQADQAINSTNNTLERNKTEMEHDHIAKQALEDYESQKAMLIDTHTAKLQEDAKKTDELKAQIQRNEKQLQDNSEELARYKKQMDEAENSVSVLRTKAMRTSGETLQDITTKDMMIASLEQKQQVLNKEKEALDKQNQVLNNEKEALDTRLTQQQEWNNKSIMRLQEELNQAQVTISGASILQQNAIADAMQKKDREFESSSKDSAMKLQNMQLRIEKLQSSNTICKNSLEYTDQSCKEQLDMKKEEYKKNLAELDIASKTIKAISESHEEKITTLLNERQDIVNKHNDILKTHATELLGVREQQMTAEQMINTLQADLALAADLNVVLNTDHKETQDKMIALNLALSLQRLEMEESATSLEICYDTSESCANDLTNHTQTIQQLNNDLTTERSNYTSVVQDLAMSKTSFTATTQRLQEANLRNEEALKKHKELNSKNIELQRELATLNRSMTEAKSTSFIATGQVQQLETFQNRLKENEKEYLKTQQVCKEQVQKLQTAQETELEKLQTLEEKTRSLKQRLESERTEFINTNQQAISEHGQRLVAMEVGLRDEFETTSKNDRNKYMTNVNEKITHLESRLNITMKRAKNRKMSDDEMEQLTNEVEEIMAKMRDLQAVVNN